MSNLFQIQAAHQICFRISRLSSLGRLWAVKSWQSWKNVILLFDDLKYCNIGCNFLLNSNLFHLGHSCACLAVHLSCKEFSSNSDDCLLMRLEQQKLLIFSLKGRDCVTQLKLDTVEKLSSPIFCLWVSVWGIGNAWPNLHFFQYIQAYKPIADPIQYIKA